MLDKPAPPAGAMPPDGGGDRTSPELSGASLLAFLSAVRQRRHVLIATLLLVPFCTWATLRQMTPMYTASGALIYEPSEYKLRELQSILRTDPITESMMTSQAELLQSLHIAERVADRGNLYEDPAFNAAKRPPNQMGLWVQTLLGMELEEPVSETAIYGPVRDPSRDRTMQAVQAALHAEPVRFSHVIQVSFTAPDPVVAAAAVNNAMDVYIKDQYAAKHKAVDNATGLLRKQASDLRSQVRRLEEAMSTYRSEHGLSQGVHAGTTTEEITHITEDLTKARAERAAADAKLDAARGNAGAQAQAAVAPSVVSMRTQLDQLAAAVESRSARLGSAHPEARALAREYSEAQRALAAEVARVVTAIGADQHAAAEREATLTSMLKAAETAAEKDNRAQIPLRAMERDLDAARAQLQGVLERIEQTAQQANVEASEAHEITQALPPDRPSSPRYAQSMAASVAAAGFLGLILVYVLHLLDGTVRSGDDVRRLTTLPCLALVPEVGKRALGHLKLEDYVARRPLTAYAEQIRALRAALTLHISHPQIVAVTAAGPAEGKSLLVLSLGRSAQLGEDRVLAIECDVRQPSFRARLGITVTPGLTEILRGDAEWRDTLRTDAVTGMHVITAGKPGGDVLSLFQSQPMRQLLADVRDHYTLILLDAPPVEAIAEARLIATLADATLMCIRWRHTAARTVLHALHVLREARATVIGAVLTRVDPRVHGRSGSADSAVYQRRYRAYFRG